MKTIFIKVILFFVKKEQCYHYDVVECNFNAIAFDNDICLNKIYYEEDLLYIYTDYLINTDIVGADEIIIPMPFNNYARNQVVKIALQRLIQAEKGKLNKKINGLNEIKKQIENELN